LEEPKGAATSVGQLRRSSEKTRLRTASRKKGASATYRGTCSWRAVLGIAPAARTPEHSDRGSKKWEKPGEKKSKQLRVMGGLTVRGGGKVVLLRRPSFAESPWSLSEKGLTEETTVVSRRGDLSGQESHKQRKPRCSARGKGRKEGPGGWKRVRGRVFSWND